MGSGTGLDPFRAELHDVAEDVDPDLAEEELGQGARSHPGGRLPRRGPLEDVAGIAESVLEHAGQIGMARPGLGEHLGGESGVGRHLLLPLRPFGVGDLDGDRRSEGSPVSDAGHQGDLVRLESHTGPPSETQPAAGQLPLDVLLRHHQTGRHPLDDHHQGATM